MKRLDLVKESRGGIGWLVGRELVGWLVGWEGIGWLVGVGWL